VALGFPNSGAPTLDQKVVGQIVAPEFWQGIFGLDPAPSNFSNLDNPQQSFLDTLYTK
jgi:hypothetical protein